MQELAAEIARLFGVRAVVATVGAGDVEVRVAAPEAPTLGTIDLAAARWALERGETSGRGFSTLASADCSSTRWLGAPQPPLACWRRWASRGKTARPGARFSIVFPDAPLGHLQVTVETEA